MKGYWVVAYREVSNPDGVANYGKLAGEVVKANGGRPLVRTNEAIEAHEVGQTLRTVIIEFPSFEVAKAAYASPEYAKALEVLGNSAVRDFRICQGVE